MSIIVKPRNLVPPKLNDITGCLIHDMIGCVSGEDTGDVHPVVCQYRPATDPRVRRLPTLQPQSSCLRGTHRGTHAKGWIGCTYFIYWNHV